MTGVIEDMADLDLWPCGLVVIDESGTIQQSNAMLNQWLGFDAARHEPGLRFIDILTRASRIFFETHLRPLLVMKGEFSEVSLELERQDGTRFGVFLNGRATLSEGILTKAHFCVFQNEQRQSFERELVAKRRESDEFRILVRSSPHAIVSVDKNLVIHAWNPAAEYLFGFTGAEAIGQRVDALLVPPEDLAEFKEDQLRIASGDAVRSETVRLRKDGSSIQVEKSIAAIHDKMEEYTGFVAIYSDISDRKATEARIKTLMQEINHRSKNLLSVVQAIARQTGRLHDGADFLAVFSERLASLTSNQDILISSRENRADLETLARAQFSHLTDPADRRLRIGGPTVHLNSSAAQAIGMAIFEMVTNAAKYGALSTETGQVAFSWAITGGTSRNIEISWIESDGPTVTEPTRKGFGYQVTGPILESITSGQTSREYAPDGFRWTLIAPIDQITEQQD